MTRCRLILLMLALTLVVGCGNRYRNGVIPPRRFADFLYDYHLAQAIGTDLQYDEKYRQELYVNYVFESHNITREEYEASLVWYTRHPEELYDIYVSLTERSEKEKKAIASRLEKIEKKSLIVKSGDSVDLWYLGRSRIMADAPLLNPFTFSVGVDSTFYMSDTLEWKVGIYFSDIFPDTMRLETDREAYLSFSIEYKDSISSVDTIARENGIYTLVLRSDSVIAPDNVMGSITYLNPDSGVVSLMFLHDITLMRYHLSDKYGLTRDSIPAAVADSLDGSIDSLQTTGSEFRFFF
ncbi:MAG: DUF4296 domain-containing protein [Bacteroidaceae bacterium]|nr:DUF4296 domain-containing protein [Bacteroidaceae bacterium]